MEKLQSKNQFINIVQTAVVNRYCMKLYCTTCISNEYRTMLKTVGKTSEESINILTKALSEIDPNELIVIPNWSDALLIAYYDLPFIVRPLILDSWITISDQSITFTDYVTYYIVRHFPKESDVWKNWISASIKLANDNEFLSESLTESLLWCISNKIDEYPNFTKYCKTVAGHSKKVKTALRKSCSI